MATIYNPKVGRDSSCVLAIDASDIESYSGSGNTWFDLSPRKNHCSPTSSSYMPTFVNNNGEKYFEFDGRPFHQNFRSTYQSPIEGLDFSITVISGFQTYNQLQQRFAPIVSCGLEGGGSTERFSALIYGYGSPSSTDLHPGTDDWSPGGRRVTNGNGISDGINYICAWTIPRWQDHTDDCRIFVDGYERPTRAYSRDSVDYGPRSFRWHIGNWQIGRDDMDWYGKIHFVYIYDRVMTPEEVFKHSKFHSGKIGKTIT